MAEIFRIPTSAHDAEHDSVAERISDKAGDLALVGGVKRAMGTALVIAEVGGKSVLPSGEAAQVTLQVPHPPAFKGPENKVIVG